MNRLTLAASTFSLLLFSAVASAQSIMRVNQSNTTSAYSDDSARAIVALKRLQSDVIVYRSLSEFEASGKLARVTLATFEQDLKQVTNEVQQVLSQMPAGRIKTEIMNALASYRDGAFWWRQINEPRVIHVSKLSAELTTPRSEVVFRATVPYTIVIHWRQAQKYLSQAENSVPK